MLFTGWELCLVKNCVLDLKKATVSLRPWAAFSSLSSHFFTEWIEPKRVNNFVFPVSQITLLTFWIHKLCKLYYYLTVVRERKIQTAKSQSDCRIC